MSAAKACSICQGPLVVAHLPEETKYLTLCQRVFHATCLKHTTGKRKIGEIVSHEEASILLGGA